MWSSVKATSAANNAGKNLGITSAISVAGPKAEDLRLTNDLQKVLESFNLLESESELIRRKEIIVKLNELFKQWVFNVSISKDMPSQKAEKLGGKIYTFGSYRLGVHEKNADIDILCVAPRNIQREDFFKSFFELLKEQREVTECTSIEEAFVPIIKLHFDGFEVDLVFARLTLQQIPDDLDLGDCELLKNLDPRCIRSLNGRRVTDEILRLLPNIENFRTALTAIKLWAKEHGIYSNSTGFFGGVTWTMLVARTCQLYPNAVAATLVHKFFLLYTRWEWPHPILLKHPENLNLGFQEWNPRINHSDRFHLMPVITPAYPQQNSTFNVSKSTKQIIIDELICGMDITEAIMMGKATWNRLFEAPSMFSRYRHFLTVIVSSERNHHDHLKWCGFIEAKLRVLVKILEGMENISLAHVNPKCFELSEKKISKMFQNSKNPMPPFSTIWFVGLEFDQWYHLNVDLTPSVANFVEHVYAHATNIELLQPGMEVEVRHVQRKELNRYLDANLLKRERQTTEDHTNFLNSIRTKKRKLLIELQQQVSSKRSRNEFTPEESVHHK